MSKLGLKFFKPTEKFNGNWSILEEKVENGRKCTEKDGVTIKLSERLTV